MSLAPPEISSPQTASCPSEDDIACFIEGRATPESIEHLLAHLDGCSSCRTLLASTLRAIEPSSGEESAARGIPRTFTAGQVVNERYRIIQFLSSGGMGEVYEVRDLELNETVALKTIACTGLDNSRLCHRMRAEVQLARRVTHPNVCRILEFGLAEQVFRNEVETIPFFTMEYLIGETLANYASRCGKLPRAEIIDIASQILAGLAAIHASGIIHRDLKPENVFLIHAEKGPRRVVVMDFGLARPLERESSLLSSHDAATPGTPAYMAPEQALGSPAAIAWDIYAFGVVLFYLAAAQLPFKGNTSVALAMARISEPAPLLSRLVPGIDPVIEDVVARCLERNPAKRFDSVVQVQSALAESHDRKSPYALRFSPGWGMFAVCGCAVLMYTLTRSFKHADHPEIAALATASSVRIITDAGMVALPSQATGSPREAAEAKPRAVGSGEPAAGDSARRNLDGPRTNPGSSNPRVSAPVMPKKPTHAASPTVASSSSPNEDDVVVPSFAHTLRPASSGGLR